jgi:hypothetical protein
VIVWQRKESQEGIPKMAQSASIKNQRNTTWGFCDGMADMIKIWGVM